MTTMVEFWLDVMKQLADILDIKHSKITSHQPNSNGVVRSSQNYTVSGKKWNQ